MEVEVTTVYMFGCKKSLTVTFNLKKSLTVKGYCEIEERNLNQ